MGRGCEWEWDAAGEMKCRKGWRAVSRVRSDSLTLHPVMGVGAPLGTWLPTTKEYSEPLRSSQPHPHSLAVLNLAPTPIHLSSRALQSLSLRSVP